ncbi:MAG: hypothetical protein ACP5PQ_02905 [Thermoproteota archaeon]
MRVLLVAGSGVVAYSYRWEQDEEQIYQGKVEVGSFSLKLVTVAMLPLSSSLKDGRNITLRIVASEASRSNLDLLVYVLNTDEYFELLSWFAEVEEKGFYVMPNVSKPVYEAEDVSNVNALASVNVFTVSNMFHFCCIILNWNFNKNVSVSLSASLRWLKPEQYVSLNFGERTGFYAGLPLIILGIYFFIEARMAKASSGEPLLKIKLLDSIAFLAILFLPTILYYFTNSLWKFERARIFPFNSLNPLDAISPDAMALWSALVQAILLHEYGHFAAARALGLKAEIKGPENRSNTLAVTSVYFDRPVTQRELLTIRRRGPLSNVLLLLVNLLLFLVFGSFGFFSAVVMNLLLVSWNSKEFSIPVEKVREEAVKPLKMEEKPVAEKEEKGIRVDQEFFRKSADKYVKLVGESFHDKLDYSLDSLNRLDELAKKTRLGIEDPEKLEKILRFYVIGVGSYLGEVLVRNLNARWEESESMLGWVVTINRDKFDVFHIAFESIRDPNRFKNLYNRLKLGEFLTDLFKGESKPNSTQHSQ